VGPSAELDILEKRNIFYPCQEVNHGLSSPQPGHYTSYDILVLLQIKKEGKTSLLLPRISPITLGLRRKKGSPCLFYRYFKSDATNTQ
jgi:hypothetical protein